ncbi:retinal guanylyl cyclase 2-like [Hydractinia symbiolongicarpus]|uniref:retinal guanylyl cyclase 2-like n=1 Tax=Hydractinia symbiolongicarpus TaxID=13093 RepID=UPI0025506B79|nr:retinal guanylyl cyclase 2-like [Hydractinia symbiolongicarpus]
MKILLVLNIITFSIAKLPLRPLKIGCLLQKSDSLYKYEFLRASIALAKNNLNHIVEEFGYNIEYVVEDSGCNEIMASGAAGHLIYVKKVHVLIGPSCSVGCVPIGYLVASNNRPIISYSCSSAILSIKSNYPTFARTRPFARVLNGVLAWYLRETMQEFKWKHLGIVYSSSDVWSSTFEKIVNVIRRLNSTQIDPTYSLESMSDRRESMKELKKKSRVILFVCYQIDVAEMLSYAHELGMYNGEYAFITIDFHIKDKWKLEPWFKTDEIFPGILNVGVMNGRGALGPGKFAEYWRNLSIIAKEEYSYDMANETYYEGAGYIYDAVKGYLLALHKTLTITYEREVSNYIKNNKIDKFLELNNLTIDQLRYINKNLTFNEKLDWLFPSDWELSTLTFPFVPYGDIKRNLSTEDILNDGISIMKNVFNSNFQGMSGDVHINANGDRYPILILDNLQRKSQDFEFVRIVEYDGYHKKTRIMGLNSIVWPGGGSVVPRSVPDCGFRGELCIPDPQETDVTLIIAAVASPFAVVLLLFFIYRAYRNNRYENDLMNQDIIFKFDELEIPELKLLRMKKAKQEKMAKRDEGKETPSVAGSDISRTSEKNAMLLSPNHLPVLAKKKKRASTSMPNLLENVGKINHVTGSRVFFGMLKDEAVFVKQIPKTIVIVNREILIELKQIRDLRHPNLNPYSGVCPGSPYVLLASPVCKKGSLIDILLNEDIQLNWIFRHAFMLDIANGLAAIHDSPIKVHGHLTSKNVLIDNRWNCTISDYGLFKFKEQHNYKVLDIDDEEKYEALLWTAPENINYQKPKMSKEGDVYSFGIIMSEIINRLPPFSTYAQYKTRDYVHFVNRRCIPPFRPHVRLQSGLDGRTIDLMRLCWDEFPGNRPSIHDVKSTLKSICKDKSAGLSLMDNMIDMMEKYAQGLENSLREVQREKEMEKEKVEKLMYSSLPPVVASELRKGETTVAQKFKTASVMLLKVDDFSSFVETLNPQQVVDLLNDVHRCINEQLTDDRIHQLPGLRDRHAFVCGIPEPVSKKHAYYIAKIALKIMGSLTNFRFRHINDELMRFKIVLHTGTFVAGLVGMNVPVYTLFGRAIEYAEFVLEAAPFLRIVVTNECKEFLDLLKVAIFEGPVPMMVKNVGVLEVNYLTGMKGVTAQLRNPNIKRKDNYLGYQKSSEA